VPVAVEGGCTVGDGEVADAVAIATHIAIGAEGVDATGAYEALSDSANQQAKRCACGALSAREDSISHDDHSVKRLSSVDSTSAVRD
jgi:hypothetical protein